MTAQIREQAATGDKVLPWFETELTMADGTVVAAVRRQVYVRRKRTASEAADPMESTNFERG